MLSDNGKALSGSITSEENGAPFPADQYSLAELLLDYVSDFSVSSDSPTRDTSTYGKPYVLVSNPFAVQNFSIMSMGTSKRRVTGIREPVVTGRGVQEDVHNC